MSWWVARAGLAIGPERVEDRAHRRARGARRRVAQRGVVRGREEERDARLAQHVRLALRRRRRAARPSASSTSALPARLETLRLPCLATGTPQRRHHDRGRGRDVERAEPVAAGAAGVDHAREAVIDGDHHRAHRLDGRGDHRPRVSPRRRSATAKPADLHRRPRAREDGVEGRAHGRSARARRRRDLARRRAGRGSPASALTRPSLPGSDATQLPSSAMPEVVRMDSGWNCTPSTACSRGAGP